MGRAPAGAAAARHTRARSPRCSGAIALYGLATLVRARALAAAARGRGRHADRADTYALNVVGYMGNNILPARAGDAIRVVLMAPRANTSKRTVVGTLVAERLLDVAVLLVIFVVVGYGLLGEVGGNSVELIADRRGRGGSPPRPSAGASSAATRGCTACSRRSPRATLGLRRAHHGLLLLGMTLLIWAIEAGVWMSVGAAVGFG